VSKIFDGLRRAQQMRGRQELGEQTITSDGADWERRRSPRWTLDVPVFVYGHNTRKQPFHEEAHTLGVSANGGLLVLGANVKPGQKLLLVNKSTQTELECRVVYLGTRRTRTMQVAIEFTHPNPAFWPVPERR